MQIGAVFQIANADNRADPVVGETLQVVDEILAREELFGHGSIIHVLVSDVPVEIDHRRHDRLARQIDVHSPGWNLQLTALADSSEQIVLNQEGGVFDGGAAVAGDEAGPFEHGHAGFLSLAVYSG
jgi:hypothetical protein